MFQEIMGHTCFKKLGGTLMFQEIKGDTNVSRNLRGYTKVSRN